MDMQFEHTATEVNLEKAIGDMKEGIAETVGEMKKEVAEAIGEMKTEVVGVKAWIITGVLINILTIFSILMTAYRIFTTS